MVAPKLPQEAVKVLERMTGPEPGHHLFSGVPSDETHHPLSDIVDYVAFAETGLRQAAERVRTIQDRTVEYAADKAFTYLEGSVIGRLARVALDRDAPWLPPVLDELFRKASVAPTAAKTMPSQSVTIALGHAVEAFPTPEAVATLRHVLRDVRHAGVKKKLQRHLRNAERGLANRPEIALRLPMDEPLAKTQVTTLARCLEAGFASGLTLDYEDWCIRLGTHAQVRALTAALVWRMRDEAGTARSILPVSDGERMALHDIHGTETVAPARSRMALWHPSEATAEERGAWRDRLTHLRIRQPFKQVFREHYLVPPEELSQTETAMFAGHVVAITPFVGVARREGWRIDDDVSLMRRFGPWTARLPVRKTIFPGCPGDMPIYNIELSASDGASLVPVRLGDLPPVTLSEILRAVDLLVSTSAFAVATAEEEEKQEYVKHPHRLAGKPLSAMAEMRKHALVRVLGGMEKTAAAQFDAKHLRLGPYAIHLATGRVTRDGEPVAIDLPKRPKLAVVPWLPYDEQLLEKIVYTAIEIAKRVED